MSGHYDLEDIPEPGTLAEQERAAYAVGDEHTAGLLRKLIAAQRLAAQQRDRIDGLEEEILVLRGVGDGA
jgi:hypothetical protein